MLSVLIVCEGKKARLLLQRRPALSLHNKKVTKEEKNISEKCSRFWLSRSTSDYEPIRIFLCLYFSLRIESVWPESLVTCLFHLVKQYYFSKKKRKTLSLEICWLFSSLLSSFYYHYYYKEYLCHFPYTHAGIFTNLFYF